MSSHIGVSCDSCSKTNFQGRRYKCLLCDNYDLCGSCYDLNSESQNHLSNHPMQCILTKTAYELFYAGESIPYRTIVSLTCPYCSISGFIPRTLLTHCLEKHPIISSETKSSQVVMCPICVISPSQEHQSRFVSLVDHILREHDEADSSVIQTYEKEDLDEDEDEGLPLYILAEQLFIKEENRRQKLAQTGIRNDCTAMVNSNTRRPLSRQTAMRGSRGSTRGHSYGTVPRTTTSSFRIPFDTTIENTILNDPYAGIVFPHDPMIEFDSPFSSLTSNELFFSTSSVLTHIPTLEPVDRQQQNENNDRLIQKKSSISNTKQKRSRHLQQQQTSQAAISTQPSNYDYLWQRNYPPSQSTSDNPLFLSGTKSPDLPIESNTKHDHTPKTKENDSQSLLEKILTTNQSPWIPHQEQDHASFFQSILLSSMNININNEQLYQTTSSIFFYK